MSNRVFSSTVLALTVGFALGLADLTVLARQEPSTQNTKQTSPSKRGTTTTKKINDTTATSTATGDQTPAATSQEMTPAPPQSETRKSRKRTAPPETATVATIQTQQTDLSGTYAGTFDCNEIGLTGDTTLTIAGNQFTTADGKSGRIVASTTQGYTAVALQIGEPTAAAPPKIVSLRGRKTGDKLTLTTVDAAHPCSFTPARAVASRRTRRSQPVAPTATEVASPAEAGPSPADVTGPANPSKRRTRRGTTKSAPVNPAIATPSPTAVPSPSPAESPITPVPTQTPMPSPAPSPTPTASPTTSPTPEASPSPTPEATPSPSPSPSPAPKRP